MAAVAHADADVAGAVDDVSGPLIVQDLQPVRIVQRGFLHEDSAQAGFALHEQIAHEIFFDIDVLMEKFTEGFFGRCLCALA